MKKILVTSGCSFSEYTTKMTKTWPAWLNEETGLALHNVAMGSQGNGLISRKLIQRIIQDLASYQSHEILVGVMWSSPDRHDFFSDDPSFHLPMDVNDGWFENPTQVTPQGKKIDAGWVICNHDWKSHASQLYYKNFYSQVGQMVYTLEHILRTQWFLEKHHIDYFMTTYTGEVLPNTLLEHTEIKHLWNQVDKQKFLPITGCYEWCQCNTDIPFRLHDNHPLSEHHEQFVKAFLIPHLKSMDLL